MNRKPPTWRLWAGIGAAAAVYAALGWWWSGRGDIEEWVYRAGLTAATVLPALFVAVYTGIGLSGRVAAAWWRDDIGTSLVIAALSVIPLAGPLAWVFWFDGGMLTSSWLAWLEVSGPCLTAAAWARLCWVWLRIARPRDTPPPEPSI